MSQGRALRLVARKACGSSSPLGSRTRSQRIGTGGTPLQLPSGEHAFHVHAVGKCDPPFDSDICERLITAARISNDCIALEKAKTEKEAHGEFESEHPGYCGAQDTFYVGNMKGVGRIYQLAKSVHTALREYDWRLYGYRFSSSLITQMNSSAIRGCLRHPDQ
jgi:hypothetical protein